VINNEIYIFTDIDLDGVGSLVAMHHVLGHKPGELKYTITNVTNLRKNLLKWLETDSLAKYRRVIFLDLDTSSCADLIDFENVTVIDHHSSHVKALGVYKHAKTFVVDTTSCARLVYATFKENLNHLTAAQKYFIGLCDDYDCYKFALPESYDLNCLFTNTQKSVEKTRTDKFLDKYFEGFTGFNFHETNIIKEYLAKRDAAIAILEIFSGTINISKEPRRVVGTCGAKFTNEVCDHLIKKHGAEVAFYYNVNSDHVSLRRGPNCKVDLSKLASVLCEGGGHENAAGGKPTPAFFEFAKSLTTKE
jgi:oligoribonuclease NrnB/cAMP/cGMP phosphodiesterase (DHH superfamily)